jgi:hypothetical protein
VASPANQVLVSVASAWEIAVKHALKPGYDGVAASVAFPVSLKAL